MRLRPALATVLFVTASIGSVACGSPELEPLGDGRPSGKTEGNGGGGAASEEENVIGGETGPATPPSTAACAVATAKADPIPLHMVVVLDKSGSMCEYTANTNPRDCDNIGSKWQQVTRGLATFFASPASAGITISLIAFPVSNGTCSASSYQTPILADVTLPDTAGALSTKIASLDADGSTPTRPALEGAINYARSVETRLAGKGKVAVVMATDGYPQDCSDNSISKASAVASAAKATIPTYVIGVGDLLADLNALASAGGTKQAFLVKGTGAAVGGNLSTALTAIRGASLACEYAMPAAPAGQTLDTAKVNVKLSTGTAAPVTVPYSAGCAAPEGWSYDNPAAPTKIKLCPTSCERAKGDVTAKIDLEIGCKTEGGAVK